MSAVDAIRPNRRRAWYVDAGLLLLRLVMAYVFIRAAIPKILEPDLFALNVFNYRMLPAWGVNAMALVLPWLELLVGLCLAVGIWRRASALSMAILMLVFMVAFASATARGLELSCGCFEVGEGEAPSSVASVVLRDLAFLAASLVLVRYPDGPRPLDLLRGRRLGLKARAGPSLR